MRSAAARKALAWCVLTATMVRMCEARARAASSALGGGSGRVREVDRHARLQIVGDDPGGAVLRIVTRANVGIGPLVGLVRRCGRRVGEALERRAPVARALQHDLLGLDIDELEVRLKGVDLPGRVAVRL